MRSFLFWFVFTLTCLWGTISGIWHVSFYAPVMGVMALFAWIIVAGGSKAD